MDSGKRRRKISLFLHAAKLPQPREASQAPPFESTQRHLRGSRAAIGGGGKKGPPILTAEIGEHERAPRAGESYLTPLRATLRDPPSKWAIKGFFPAGERSEPRTRTAPKGLPQDEARDAQRGGPPLECRAAGFLLHTFLSPSKEKCESPMGRQVPLPRRRRRVKPGRKKGLRLRAHQRAFLGANNRRGSHCRALRLLFA